MHQIHSFFWIKVWVFLRSSIDAMGLAGLAENLEEPKSILIIDLVSILFANLCQLCFIF